MRAAVDASSVNGVGGAMSRTGMSADGSLTDVSLTDVSGGTNSLAVPGTSV